MRLLHISSSALTAVSIGLLVACGMDVGAAQGGESTAQFAAEDVLQVPESWIGHEFGLNAPVVRDVRALDASRRASGEGATSDMVVFDAARNISYELEYDRAAVAAVADKMQARMIAQTKLTAASTTEADSEALVQKAIVGTDGRQRLGIADGYAKDFFPFSAIGKVRTNTGRTCTGTLVAERLVLTAAHCVLNSSHQFQQGTFDPRIDGTNSNVYLNPVQPWGSWQYTTGAVSNEFINRNCMNTAGNGGLQNPNPECFGADWAVLIVDQPAGMGHPGAMCYAWHTDKSVLNTYFVYTGGYPACGISGSPANCKNDTLYGDSRDCVLGADVSFDSSGYARGTDFDCDISGGQSGSPIYVYYPAWLSGCTAAVIGVESGNRPLNGAYINTMRRLTPELTNYMTLLDSLF